jgi:hypothetical protein
MQIVGSIVFITAVAALVACFLGVRSFFRWYLKDSEISCFDIWPALFARAAVKDRHKDAPPAPSSTAVAFIDPESGELFHAEVRLPEDPFSGPNASKRSAHVTPVDSDILPEDGYTVKPFKANGVEQLPRRKGGTGKPRANTWTDGDGSSMKSSEWLEYSGEAGGISSDFSSESELDDAFDAMAAIDRLEEMFAFPALMRDDPVAPSQRTEGRTRTGSDLDIWLDALVGGENADDMTATVAAWPLDAVDIKESSESDHSDVADNAITAAFFESALEQSNLLWGDSSDSGS